ncbi:putative chorismate synthase protein [Lasiodiplodia theobromae]|uniref:Chorismate synthase n=1 Tax=Lasiodiplodia theobromae TaxID=45133 RepID=A0A5N5D4E1_9PEZI|nr:Chorismate synthase [Lasiodiplodia theobromae]KAF9641772.1 putative chorismate synthase protein [Lasiodiplodia theobromae]
MSTFGKHFRVTTYGESHCHSVGCIVDGCPPGMQLAESDIQPQLTRRRPGQSALSTPRDEKDRVEIQSGVEFGVTLGTPIGMRVRNEDQRPADYGNSTMDAYPRPSHADYTYMEKYGVKASSGGGRSSARETIGRVAAGAVAEKYLRQAHGVEIVAFTLSVGPEALLAPSAAHPTLSSHPDFLALLDAVDRAAVDASPVRCPALSDAAAATGARMAALIAARRDAADSVGGTVACVVRGAPAGLGEPCFDKLEAALAHAMLSIPAAKGFEIGAGFAGCAGLAGSAANDAFVVDDSADQRTGGDDRGRSGRRKWSRLRTRTNHSGGVQGGITNGEHVFFTVAFKPPATIGQAQRTAGWDGVDGVLAAKGRHDPCVVPRAVPVVEAMAALVIMDAVLAQQARSAARELLAASEKAV